MESQEVETATLMDQYQDNNDTVPLRKGARMAPKKRGRSMLGNILQKKQRGYWTSQGGDVLLERVCYAYGLSGSSAVDMVLADWYAANFEKIELLIQQKKKPRVTFR